MAKAYLVMQGNLVVNKIVNDDPDALVSIKGAYADPEFTIKEFDSETDPAFVNSNNDVVDPSIKQEATNG